MKVLTVGSLYPPHHLGGYEVAWQGAVERYRSAGHEVRVLASDYRSSNGVVSAEDRDLHRELRSYWRDHEFPRRSLAGRAKLERHNGRVLERHLDAFRPDIVSWWAMGGVSLSLLERSRRSGVPSLAVVCDDWLIYGPQVDQWTRAFARRRGLGKVAELLTGGPARVDPARAVSSWLFLSRTVLEHARRAGFAGDPVEVAHPGVNRELFRPAEPEPWRGRLLYVGRIEPRKGIDLAVETVALLPDATLTIDGSGDERHRGELERTARARGVEDRIRFTRSPRDRLPAAYAAADAVLFPVRWEEPWGLVPLEAMAVGRPVIATGRGGSGEYLEDGRNSLLFDPEMGAEGLATAIRRLAEDPALRATLIEGGHETAELHPAGAFDDAVLELSERLVASSR